MRIRMKEPRPDRTRYDGIVQSHLQALQKHQSGSREVPGLNEHLVNAKGAGEVERHFNGAIGGNHTALPYHLVLTANAARGSDSGQRHVRQYLPGLSGYH
jgi:hypothetical protein